MSLYFQKKTSIHLASKGFTLVELLIVLFIIGLSSSIIILNTSRPHKKQKPELITFLQQEYKKALLNSQIIEIKLVKNQLQSSSSAILQLPEQKAAKTIQYLSDHTLTTFYPDGTMSASNFTITTKTASYDIKTTPFSSNIHYTIKP